MAVIGRGPFCPFLCFLCGILSSHPVYCLYFIALVARWSIGLLPSCSNTGWVRIFQENILTNIYVCTMYYKENVPIGSVGTNFYATDTWYVAPNFHPGLERALHVVVERSKEAAVAGTWWWPRRWWYLSPGYQGRPFANHHGRYSFSWNWHGPVPQHGCRMPSGVQRCPGTP